jgi:phosphatidate cytidylyltransferase
VALVAFVFLLNTPYPIGLNIIIAIISIIALYELQITTGYIKNAALTSISFLFAAGMAFLPFFVDHNTKMVFSVMGVMLFLFIAIMFWIMLRHHSTIGLDKIGLVFLTTVMISAAFMTMVMLRDRFGIFHVILLLVMSWSTDICAFFSGKLFGKHKMTPTISPNKTIEGAIGGVISSVVISVAFAYIYQLMFNGVWTKGVQVRFWPLLILSLCCSLISIFGDLSFSIIKRHCNIKDFGKIMPGHGGVLDRFDSIIFVSPFLFLYLQFCLVVIN